MNLLNTFSEPTCSVTTCALSITDHGLLFCLQVFSMFLETLVDFVTVHREDLQDWLFVLLTQLLKKMGADLLGSVQAKVQKALDITRSVSSHNSNPGSHLGFPNTWITCCVSCLSLRESFPFDQQFNILMRFIVDQTQTPNLKVQSLM